MKKIAIREIEKGYYVEVYLGKDPLTGKKLRKTKLFTPANRKTLKEAKMWEADTLSDYKTGNLDLKGSMRLSAFLDYWFDTYVIPNTAYQTQKRYKTLCNCIKDHLGHLPLETIKAPIIDRFYADLKQEMIELKDGTKKRRYMDGTILKTHRLLRQALDKAVGWEMISKNAADYAVTPKDDEREISYWSIKESESFMKIIKDTELYLPVFIAFHTGMREGEICALRWEDINFEEDYIMVNHNMVQKKRILDLDDPKTPASKDKVALTKQLKEKLQQVKNHQKLLFLQSGKQINFDYVCCWKDGRPLRPMYIAKAFTREVKKYGFKKITFHGLRHTHATILYSLDVQSHDISKRLRHSRVSTTDDIYIHITDEIKKSTADIFSKAVEQEN